MTGVQTCALPICNNKYSLLGALRSGAQMISYEISFAMILLFVVMISGSTNLMSITMGQEGTIFDWWIFKIPVLGFIAFILFFISSTAEMNRAPFDIAEAEQELTGGYHTEYNGTPFAMSTSPNTSPSSRTLLLRPHASSVDSSRRALA